MNAVTLSVVLCFAALALRAQAQDNVVFLPPSDLDKDAPTVDEGKPTQQPDKDKTFGHDNGKDKVPTTATDKPTDPPVSDETESGIGPLSNEETTVTAAPETRAERPTAAAITAGAAPVTASAVPAENCTRVRCSLDVLKTCSHPVLLPGRCCPSCPNQTVCSGVRCGYNKICSEHGGRAICCEKHSYTAHSRRAMLRRTLDAVNEFGEDCSLRYEHHGYVRACNRGKCTQNETCYPSSERYVTCCNRRPATKPTCFVTQPKILGRCQLPPTEDEQRNCTCRVVMTMPFGYFGRRYGYRRRHRRNSGRHGYRRGDRHGRDHDSTFITIVYSRAQRKVYMVSCHGPTDVCRAKLAQTPRRHRRSVGGLFGHVFRGLFGRRNHSNRRVRMCRTVRV